MKLDILLLERYRNEEGDSCKMERRGKKKGVRLTHYVSFGARQYAGENGITLSLINHLSAWLFVITAQN